MEKAKINAYQLFVLVVLYEMGSALLFGLGSKAKQDAWIAILLGLGGGLVLFLVYYRLFKFYPDIPITSYVQKITGKWIGRLIGLLYTVYFLFQAFRILRDFGELLVTTSYNNTPLVVINALMLLTIIYAIHKGFEVIARVSELFFAVVYFLALMGFFLILFSGLIHLDNLQPMLENGWKPIFKTVFGQTVNFPFGEMVVFTMFLPYINDHKKVKISCIGGMIISGINIAITAVVNIAVLGIDTFTRANFPLLSTISKIHLAEFIERLDIFFMLYLVIGGFFKIAIFYYAGVMGIADIFKFKNQRKLVFPIGFIILLFSITVSSNFAEQMKEGEIVIEYYLHYPFQVIIPVILLIIAYFRNMNHQEPIQM
ncbi:GerAB/ArcD/ProY family transporter [Neobacillus ginsengisoli]|uniref:Spore germination protein KB n=1 Tax=Neobacillus ginsengisoli TaxID=904295 RepID=A0ABT9Y267_9BACI|nr:GerAB/ArcD/ProY family transporter [Neobacillus ginsengisoli]MDQ0201908.1 spore germination protein KB [Neobacillus ginsengisoli]